MNKAIPERPDVYGIHGFWYGVLCLSVGLALKARGKRVIYDVHEDYPAQMAVKYWIPTRLRSADGDTAMTTPGHTYPSDYPPGTHWATDEAWHVLDILKPGVLSDDVRFFLAGAIAGTLMRVARIRLDAEGEKPCAP